jgi:hypothetical protein
VPVAYTTSAPDDDLSNGVVFCRVESWLTGRRLVSLPFADHCEPLVDTTAARGLISAALESDLRRERWNYWEIRPLTSFKVLSPFCNRAVTYAFHQLDLGPDLDSIFSNFHKSSTQRKIHRAKREGLHYREGSTEKLLDDFYLLFVLTRRRHGVPPQPKKWFKNLIDCFGDALKIRVTLKDKRVIAAMITIRHKETLTYKYGCSDPRFNNLGSMHLLFWTAIQEAKSSGLRLLDFGRTDIDQSGLITFKGRWGAARTLLTYSRYSISAGCAHFHDLDKSKRESKLVKRVLKLASPRVLTTLGQIAYKHIA